MRKKRVAVIVVLLMAAAAGGAYWRWRQGQPEQAQTELVLYGNVDIRQVELAFNGSERIAKLAAQEGDRVKQGQLLGSLEKVRLENIVARVAAQVKAQEQIVERLVAGSRPQEIHKARAEKEAAAAEARNANQIYERRRPLAKQDAISKEQTAVARNNARAAEARLRAAGEVLDLAVEGPRKEDIAAARATLEAYRAELAFEHQRLMDADLFAPTDGVIQNRILEPGDMASPQRAVYTLALTNPVWVRAYVPENQVGKIWLGMSARVETDSYPGKRYEAWVGFISPTAEFTPKSVETTELRTKLVYQVRVYVCNPENQLRLGMPATVTIPLDQPVANERTEADRCKQN
ncbi:efflux RND transporter periplasmic adaptor subunit [Desulfoferrobacter suflitae]|uniref:efflux RND transporter periplasmic adaptor subunit n=1 Tax=Desulfoferrobacter suflitae TaxID=2865782 RepID=UPI0021646F2F|nr:efflux RND transporter periplasmic adaptor subunit [Desulfoferrobacter suflitae]MCK8600788.1 efflux RND transporter periplasmic adaptor subunit [Desulfoferrobacter suflitae]